MHRTRCTLMFINQTKTYYRGTGGIAKSKDPYGSRSTPRGNYGSAGPSTYGNPGQITYGQCNDQSGLNPFGNIRSNPGIFTPRGNSSYSCNNGHPGRLTYRECSGCGGSGNSGNPGRLTYGERSDRYDMKSSGQRDRKNRRHAMRKGSRKRDSSSDNNSDSNSGSGSGSDNDSDSENNNENDSDSESES